VIGRASATARWGFLAAGMFVALLPFLWMLRTALGPAQDVLSISSNPLPSSVGFGNFSGALHAGDLTRALINGVIVSAAILALQLATALPAAYAFACLRFRGRNALFGLVLAALLIPPQVVAVPNYVTISAFGLADTRLGLVLPFMTNGIAVFLLRQYMTTIPPALLEAARMDGLGTWRTLRRIVVPLSAPAIATVATFSFLLSFNEYLWPLLEARSPTIATPPLALARLASGGNGFPDFAQLCAGALLVSLPTLIVFIVAQRRLSAGLAGTGVSA
jgi:multiple sugar transport system permease protein